MPAIETRAQTAAPPFPPLDWAGVGTCALTATDTVAPRLLPYHALMLTTAGQGCAGIDFLDYPCRPGALLWIRPGQALSLRQPGLDATLVTFEDSLVHDLPDLAGIADQPHPWHWQLEGEDEDAVISEFTQLAVDCERHRPSPTAAALMRHQLAVVLARIALLSGPVPDGPEHRTFVLLRRLVEQGYPTSRRVEDYATQLGCSVRTLTRACLAVTGRTAKQVVDDRVALEARRLLACSPLPIAAVGRRLGFPEPTNFGRFFLRETGVSPGQFRADFGDRAGVVIPAPRQPRNKE